jgi:uncharacterized repeat protein (TIGR03803 family)
MPSLRLVLPLHRSRATRASHAAWLLLASVAAYGQTAPAVSTIMAFNGSVANGGLIEGPGGLYGTTSANSLVSGGLIYRTTDTGSSVETLHQFGQSEAYAPKAALLKGSDGLLYGTTRLGPTTVANSTGAIYRMATDGTGFTILRYFDVYATTNVNGNPINHDGAFSESALIEGSDTSLYGVTRAGGDHGTGVVFMIHRDGTGFTVLHQFGPVTSAADDSLVKNADGSNPLGSLVEAYGYLWGTAASGGIFGRGTIFRLHLDGTGFEVVHQFSDLSSASPQANVDGAAPVAGLTDGGDGMLYGVASVGGAKGVGTLFAVDPNTAQLLIPVMHDFDTPDGANPSGALIVGMDSRLYGVTGGGGTNSSGTTTGLGTIFSIARDGTGFTKLHSFEGSHGALPTGPLLQLNATTFVGITVSGGKCSQGTVFQYSSTGATVSGNTTCGQKKKNQSGGGALAPALLLLLGALGLAPRRRRH